MNLTAEYPATIFNSFMCISHSFKISTIESNTVSSVFCSCSRRLNAAMFSPQNADTVQFSNEAFNDNSMMSFDNVLYGNLDDPVLMTPLEFPIDDKEPLPQVHLTELVHSIRS